MADLDNYRRGQRFRELVGVVLDRRGVQVAIKPRYTTIRDAIEIDSRMASDVALRDWALTTVSTRSQNLWSRALDGAERAAQADKKPFYATVLYRPERPPAEQYVLTTLGVLADLAANGIEPQIGDES